MSIKITTKDSSGKSDIKHITYKNKENNVVRLGEITYVANTGDIMNLYQLIYPINNQVIQDTKGGTVDEENGYIYGREKYISQISPKTNFFPPSALVVTGATLQTYFPENGNFILTAPQKGIKEIVLQGKCRGVVKIDMKNTGTFTYSPKEYNINISEGEYYGGLLVDYDMPLEITLVPYTEIGLTYPKTISVSGADETSYIYDSTTGVIKFNNVINSPIFIVAECPLGEQLFAPNIDISGDILNINTEDDRTEQYEIYINDNLIKTIDKS